MSVYEVNITRNEVKQTLLHSNSFSKMISLNRRTQTVTYRTGFITSPFIGRWERQQYEKNVWRALPRGRNFPRPTLPNYANTIGQSHTRAHMMAAPFRLILTEFLCEISFVHIFCVSQLLFSDSGAHFEPNMLASPGDSVLVVFLRSGAICFRHRSIDGSGSKTPDTCCAA